MKKSGFLTFIFSMLPGCGLMYLGYMKKGLQVMLTFVASCFLAYTFDRFSDWIMIFFILLLPVIWFYQMFDSMHSVSRMKKLEIDVPADDGFFIPPKLSFLSPAQNPAAAKVLAVVLIFLGGFGLVFGVLDNMHFLFEQEMVGYIVNSIRNYLASAIVSITLIVIGVKLLKGSKIKRIDNEDYIGKE